MCREIKVQKRENKSQCRNKRPKRPNTSSNGTVLQERKQTDWKATTDVRPYVADWIASDFVVGKARICKANPIINCKDNGMLLKERN